MKRPSMSLDTFKACVRGTGNELAGLTARGDDLDRALMAGEIDHDVADSRRFDLWEREAELAYHLLDVCDSYLAGL